MGFQRVSNGHCQPGAAMSEKPIIFSAPMVRSILSGTKTQTRRVAKITGVMGDQLPVTAEGERLIELEPGEFNRGVFHYESLSALSGPYRLPAAVGDMLWVREACRADEDMADQKYVEYLADSSRRLLDLAPDDNCSDAFSDWWNLMAYRSNDPGLDGSKPVPSIHMPRWASRITLKVTGVKVERLNDISEEDAKAEGVFDAGRRDGAPYSHFTVPGVPGITTEHDAVSVFVQLWESINGPDSWEANPWVAAISFERLLSEGK